MATYGFLRDGIAQAAELKINNSGTIYTIVDDNRDLMSIRNAEIDGNLTVKGTTVTVSASNLVVQDKHIELNHDPSGTRASNVNAGLIISGSSQYRDVKLEVAADGSKLKAYGLTPGFDINTASGSSAGYSIGGTSVLNATTLGTNVVASSLTSVGTITSLVATTADINGGTVDATIGGTTPAAGTFTTISGTTVAGTAGTLTSLNLQNGGITNAGAVSGITAVSASGRIFTSGLLSTDADFGVSGSSTMKAITATTFSGSSTITAVGAISGSGALSCEGALTAGGGLVLQSSGITSAGTIAGATGITSTGTATFATVTGSGTATFNAMTSDTVDINGGAIDGTAIGANSAAAGTFTTIAGTTISGTTVGGTVGTLTELNLQSGGITNAGTIAGATGITSTGTATFATVTGSGTATFNAMTSDTVDINGGAIDGTAIGANSAAAGTFAAVKGTTLSGSSTLQVGGATTVAGNITPLQDVAYDLGSTSKRWANVYTGDLHLKNERGDWTLYEEANDIMVRNNLSGKMFKLGLVPVEEDKV